MNSYFCSQEVDSHQGKGIYLIGLQFDGTACFRKGASRGPEAIRRVSENLEAHSPSLEKSLEHLPHFYDLGNIDSGKYTDDQAIPIMEEKYHQKLSGLTLGESQLITLGGEHSISYIPLKSYLHHYEDLVVIHLDAHADLRDGYQGFHYSHASIIYRTLELFGPKHQLVQYGIRSGTAQEYKRMRKQKTLCPSREEFFKKIEELNPQRPIYLTFDLDYFDPSILPGTGTPEPGGEDFHSFQALIKILNRKNFVGADVVELAPNLDPSDMSSIVASKVVREIALTLGKSV